MNREDLVTEYGNILNLLTTLVKDYGKKSVKLEGVKEQHLNFLAGFNLIQTIQKINTAFGQYIVDIDMIILPFYADNLERIDQFWHESVDHKRLEIINRIFRHDKINHCSNCCDYGSDGEVEDDAS